MKEIDLRKAILDNEVNTARRIDSGWLNAADVELVNAAADALAFDPFVIAGIRITTSPYIPRGTLVGKDREGYIHVLRLERER